jgi:hypothetical protein
MKIVCKIKRALGTNTKMPDDGTVYAFRPNAHGDHVAEVTNLAHIQRLLAIDAYAPYDEAAVAEAAQALAKDNELDELEQRLDPALAPDLEKMTLEELQAEYHYRFGKVAPKQIKFGTLVAKLAAARMKPTQE